MKPEIKRLLRLAQAQLQLSRLLEARIIATRQELSELQETRAATFAALDRAGSAGLVVYAAALRRLADLDTATSEATARLKVMNRRLLDMKGRQDILMRRAGALQASAERILLEAETREALLSTKARGKPGVVE